MIENTIRQIVREELEQTLQRVLGSALAPPSRGGEAKYLNQKEAASIASVSKSTIQEWILSGRLRANRIGRLIRIKPSDLEAAISTATSDDAKRQVTLDDELVRILGGQ